MNDVINLSSAETIYTGSNTTNSLFVLNNSVGGFNNVIYVDFGSRNTIKINVPEDCVTYNNIDDNFTHSDSLTLKIDGIDYKIKLCGDDFVLKLS